MPKIHQLSPEIIAKIAAGEVIERPTYAIKELIENAIDAQADEITIYLEDAGLKKIQVIDNGEGMDKKDLEISWKPHTTSKLTPDENLLGITSFGFRGEALASLAAVSLLSIQSKTKKESIGNFIQIQDSKVIAHHQIGMPQGTVVTAEYLFSSIPARKKFLKSTQTELRHCIDMVQSFVLAYPRIHFTLFHNKRLLFDTPKTQQKEDRIEKLLGKELSLFIPFSFSNASVTFSGFLAKPQLHATTTYRQFFFVNNRRVSDKLLSLAVREAFGTMLESHTYPIFVIFLTLPYELVDVNVHPRKEQVSFVNPQTLFQLLKEGIQEILQENNITFQNLSWARRGVGTTKTFAADILKEQVLSKQILPLTRKTQIVQLSHLYILIQLDSSIAFIDQHAAHERILFEKLKNEFSQQKKKLGSIKLRKPITLSLSLQEKLLLQENEKQLQQVGFTIHNTMLYTIPTLLKDRNPHELVTEIINTLMEGKPLKELDTTSEEMLAFLACRAAVKAGDTLDKMQMKTIIKQLDETPNNSTCPHGRPTQVHIPLQSIHTLFKR